MPCATHRKNGQLDIRVTESEKEIHIAFCNAVDHMLPEDLPYLFERFYRGEKSARASWGAPESAWAIVKELVAAHGGQVGADLIDGRIHIWFSLPKACRNNPYPGTLIPVWPCRILPPLGFEFGP